MGCIFKVQLANCVSFIESIGGEKESFFQMTG